MNNREALEGFLVTKTGGGRGGGQPGCYRFPGFEPKSVAAVVANAIAYFLGERLPARRTWLDLSYFLGPPGRVGLARFRGFDSSVCAAAACSS